MGVALKSSTFAIWKEGRMLHVIAGSCWIMSKFARIWASSCFGGKENDFTSNSPSARQKSNDAG